MDLFSVAYVYFNVLYEFHTVVQSILDDPPASAPDKCWRKIERGDLMKRERGESRATKSRNVFAMVLMAESESGG